MKEKKAIKNVIDLFHLGKWSLKASQEEESSTEEEKDGDGGLEDSDN